MQDAHSKPSRFSLQFLGANATVTGSRHLVTAGNARILVDCGLFQGYKPLRLRNWAEFPVDPASIDAVLLTHAHLDHSGYLPRLVRSGFRGKVWCTEATRSLCGILLPDSGRLLEEEAGHANHSGWSKHHPAEPLYSEADARASLARLRGVGFDHGFEPVPGVHARFRAQGHILGAAAVTLEFEGRRITFSGDLGRPDDPLMPAPASLAASDWVVVESTYGNRAHPADGLEEELLAVLQRVVARKGVVVIPAFAVGRAQMLLHVITQLQASGRLAKVPVYLNSPMAASVTGLYRQFPRLHRLDAAELDAMQRTTHVVESVEQSKALNRHKGPMIIVSASGMATGGRVLHHLVAFAPDPRNAIVLCGFQAGGTRGAALAAGQKHLRIFGQEVQVGAEVVQLAAGSAHADASEILAWLRTAPTPPRGVFVTHGEPDAADALRTRIKHELGWPAHFPEYLEQVELA
ncbi:MBL fold metallo-hydrolase [Thermomonas sp.]|uniref:MBL fold metallo-hydrolase RNA specificity domain-containing protein n=1 Tax=Thermomonas sp. TaxID=1971895 RepID=UPI001B5FC497|nr:MBL fold metallo-hydrolase [Thermomonas sp.]MBK6417002.1 MBL fold metallo-hydrolase [Thermomonas sp.]MBK6924235.1 MBL fold metallo-hydrolase [Thermomonas sp.]MBK7204712.1 MBL fold metallo-hydrolase [Thermomonas sp.]MBK9670253.1 MBL fold metallo-hydrolase [Thermomonas sp.]MBL0227144.1 MBL fold metallo-hydrolase [Thermomonas sp.]